MITAEQLEQLNIKQDSVEWSQVLNDLLPKYNVNSPQRIAAFIAQCSHESAYFTRLIENLNYSAKGLIATWPRRFTTTELANKYARQPEMIANFVYANRMGNGDEASGDGWKYRGRGLIQLTGKYNYDKFARQVGMNPENLDEVCYYLETKQGAAEAACLFWSNKNLNDYADVDDIKGMTKVINGGLLGLAEREENYTKALTVLGS